MKMKKLHQHLENNIAWYKHWHEGSLHKIIHYGLLVFTILFTTGLILTATSTRASVMTYYISPTGDDTTGNGSITAPWKNLTKLESVTLNPGDTVYIREGTYRTTKTADKGIFLWLQNIRGTASNPITISGYPGEGIPVFNLDNITPVSTPAWAANPTAVYLGGTSYLHLKRLRITGLKQISSGVGISRGLALASNSSYASDHNTIEQVEVDHMGGTGVFLENSSYNLILNTDSHHNADSLTVNSDGSSDAFDNADGFGITGQGNTSHDNVFDGIRTWVNSDDGTDFFWNDSFQTIKNSWAFWNGYYQPGTAPMTVAGNGNGFKLGPTQTDKTASSIRIISNNISFGNLMHGFDQNGTPTTLYQVYNNTSYGNGGWGFQFQYYPSSAGVLAHTIRNNVALANSSGALLNGGSSANVSNNSWNGGVTLNAADFQSVSSVGVDGPRQADGSLPDLPFLKLVSSSDLIDKGVAITGLPTTLVGADSITTFLNGILPFSGTKPDLGAYETGTVTPGDTVSPSTSLTSPTTGTTVLGTTQQVAANATDNVGVTKVEFYIDGTTTLLNCTPNPDTTSPYLCIWNTTTVSNGTHTITSKAYDAAGNSGISSVVSVNVQNPTSGDTTPPVVAMTAPATNSSYGIGATVNLTAHATDDVAMAKVEFYQGSTLIGTQTSGPNSDFIYSWNTTGLSANTYVVTAKAYDSSSNIATSSPINLILNAATDGISPTVSITNPVAGYYRGGTRMTLKATASDNVGVTKVEFYVNDVLKCTDATVSYTCSWSMPSSTTVTSYTIKAKAYDAAGNIGTSADVKTTNKKIGATLTANAGANQTITLPTNSVTLAGTYTTNSLSNTITWTKISGSGVITTPSSLTTTVTGLTAGTSVFQLSVNNGTTTVSDTMDVTVNSASTGNFTFQPLVITANAGGILGVQSSVTSTNTITKVEFYLGTTLIGTDTTHSPYDIAGGAGWNSTQVANGTYQVTSKAYDDLGNSQSSAPVSVTISN